LPFLEAGDRLEWLINGVVQLSEVDVQLVRDARTAETPGLQAFG